MSYGGHARAAGFEIERSQIEGFARSAVEAARTIAARAGSPAFELDLEVTLPQLTPALVSEIERLAPFGERNPMPLFAAMGVRVAGRPSYVAGSKRVSFVVEQGGTSLRAVLHPACELLPEPDPLPGRLDLALTPRLVRDRRDAVGAAAAAAYADQVELLVRDLRAAP